MSCGAFTGLGEIYMLESESPQSDRTASVVIRTQSLLLNSKPMAGPRAKQQLKLVIKAKQFEKESQVTREI